jgi:hypothetical protein
VFASPASSQVHPAPGPEEVNWESLWFNHGQRRVRQFVTTPFAILVVFAPVSLLTSAISSLNTQFCQVRAGAAAGAAVARLPPLLLLLLLPPLPWLLWRLHGDIKQNQQRSVHGCRCTVQ